MLPKRRLYDPFSTVLHQNDVLSPPVTNEPKPVAIVCTSSVGGAFS